MIGKRGFALAKGRGLPYSLADMNLKQNLSFFAGFLALAILLSVTGCSTALPYQESRRGSYFYINPFSHKPATPEAHWDYAMSLKDRGHLKSAREEFEILVKRWPDSPQAADAKQMVASILYDQKKYKKSFETYEELIKDYYTGLKDYDAILGRQFTIAETEMNRRRMRWLFGGYRAPERAVPMFESILQNAPQWDRAPEVQYLVGQAYQKNDDLELAVVSYSTVEYRYPSSPYAEKAAAAKVDAYRKLVEETPYSVDIREQAKLAADMFTGMYPNSEFVGETHAFQQDLREQEARHIYEVGEFYERIPRPPKTNSAAIYYEKTVDQYGGTAAAVQSAARMSVLFPGGTSVLADGSKAPITGAEDNGAGGATAAGTAAAAETGAVAAAAAPSGPVEVAPLPERTALDDEAIEVTADKLEYSGDLLVGEGHVAFQQQGASLQADRVTINPDTGEITASGNILMMRDGNRWEGQELVYNYKTREGTFGESMMFFDPAYITAGKTERIATNEYVMTDVMMTTCSGEKPLVYARAKEVRVLDENKPSGVFIKAKHVTFYVGPVPVFYTPVWQRHLGYRVFTFTVGVGGKLGAYVMGRAELHPTDWLTANTHFDLYSKRGLGLGQDFDWTTPNGQGGIKTYYISDNDPDVDDFSIPEQALIDSERYRVKVQHREQIDDDTYFMTQLNWLSDPAVIDNFFTEEYRNEANPENYAVIQRSTETYALGLRADRRLNDFYTTIERIPELTYDRYRAKLGSTPLQFESENSLGFFESLNAELPGTMVPPNYRSARFDTYNRLFLPLRFQDFFNVIPRAGYRGTWYSETANGASDANVRSIFEFGTLASFKAYKTLTDQNAFFGSGLRHVIEPYADYLYRAEPNLRPTDLHQFDEIDELDEENAVRFGARNFLQTKRGSKRIANFLDSDVYTSYRFDRRSGEREFGPLVADAEMSLTDNFFIQGDAEYDWYTHDLTPANDLMTNRSLVSASAVLFPNAKWSYQMMARYDIQRDEWERRQIMVNHKFNCIGMGLGFQVDEDDELNLWLRLWLTAFDSPSSNF
jgi:lipopolysaccharide assembly outer membrane protein LptD (OstA)/outer membrane protein assembly factor BamD (BamD/ComL family)